MSRVIVLADEINPETTKDFLAAFAEMDAEDGPIEVQVCSDGGWVNGGFAIWDAIRAARNHVTTVGFGTVGSISFLIFQAGHTRLLGPTTSMFLHEGSVHAEGTLQQLKTYIGEARRLDELYVNLISVRSGLEVGKVQELCRKDTYLNAAEAIAYGFADGLLVSRKARTKKRKLKTGR